MKQHMKMYGHMMKMISEHALKAAMEGDDGEQPSKFNENETKMAKLDVGQDAPSTEPPKTPSIYDDPEKVKEFTGSLLKRESPKPRSTIVANMALKKPKADAPSKKMDVMASVVSQAEKAVKRGRGRPKKVV